MILQGFPEKRKNLTKAGRQRWDGWMCTALSAADCGCGESIDDGLVTSWRCRGAERLRYRQGHIEMLFHPLAHAFLDALCLILTFQV